jgi:membrane associated rhomboid family serine protease
MLDRADKTMLLPIGHEETTVRRMPWVTLTVIGLCVLVFILTLLAPSGEERIATAEARALEYFLDHPYLELDQELKGYAYYALKQMDRQVHSEPDDFATLRSEQAELDAFVDAYYETRGQTPYFRWGLVPTDQRAVAWFTHMLMHVGLLHLFGNLFILYLAGPPLEDAWGHVFFALFCVASGLVAAFFFVAGYPDIDEPLIGASGAISGVMGAFAIRYWNTKITFFYFVFFLKIYTGTFAAPAWLMLGLWVFAQFAYASGWWAFTSFGDMGDIAFEAHIAGFIFGIAVAVVVKKLAFEQRFVDRKIQERGLVHEARAVEKAHELVHLDRVDEAIALLEAELDHNPRDADAASALWNIAAAVGGEPAIAHRMVPALEASARTGDEGIPALCWGEVLKTAPQIDIAPATAVRLGEIALAAGLDDDAAATLRWLENRVSSSTPVGQLVRLARMASRMGIRAPFADLALARPELPPEVAEELRDLG